jgi:hypothetical protein
MTHLGYLPFIRSIASLAVGQVLVALVVVVLIDVVVDDDDDDTSHRFVVVDVNCRNDDRWDGGGLLTSAPRFDAKNTACTDSGKRYPSPLTCCC